MACDFETLHPVLVKAQEWRSQFIFKHTLFLIQIEQGWTHDIEYYEAAFCHRATI